MVKKFIAAGVCAAVTIAGLVLSVSATSYPYAFKLSTSQFGYTGTRSRNNCSYGAVQDSGNASSSWFYNIYFCNSSHVQCSTFESVNTTAEIHSEYDSGAANSTCLKVINTYGYKEISGGYNQNGSNF